MADIIKAGLIQQRWTGDKDSMIRASVDAIDVRIDVLTDSQAARAIGPDEVRDEGLHDGGRCVEEHVMDACVKHGNFPR